MSWSLDSQSPIYLQLAHRIRMQIISGQYVPGDRLPGVRDLAVAAAVNPNTMQRALWELEQEQLVITQGTSGRFVTPDKGRIAAAREGMLLAVAQEYAQRMRQFGLNREQAAELVRKTSQEGENETWNAYSNAGD